MILLTVFIASIVLPDFYKTSFKRNVKYVSLNYSEVTKQFVIWGLKDGVLLDTLGVRLAPKRWRFVARDG